MNLYWIGALLRPAPSAGAALPNRTWGLCFLGCSIPPEKRVIEYEPNQPPKNPAITRAHTVEAAHPEPLEIKWATSKIQVAACPPYEASQAAEQEDPNSIFSSSINVSSDINSRQGSIGAVESVLRLIRRPPSRCLET